MEMQSNVPWTILNKGAHHLFEIPFQCSFLSNIAEDHSKMNGVRRQEITIIDGNILENITMGVEQNLVDYFKVEQAIKKTNRR